MSVAEASGLGDKRTTLADVAKLAGTSKATASRVLSGRSGGFPISASTIARVQEAARALDFQPNAAARALTTRRSHLIAVVLPGAVDGTHAYSRFAHLKISELLSGVVASTREHGYNIVLQIIDSERPAASQDRLLWRSHGIDGVLWLVQPLLEDMGDIGCPIVTMNAGPPPPGVAHAVNSDVYAGTHLAMSHLRSMGHTRIAHVAGPSRLWIAAERKRGYLDATSAFGQIPLVVDGDLSEDSGTRSIEQMWTATSAPPTAVLAGNDLMALGVIRGLRTIGLRIPDDVAVVGSDGLDLAPNFDPPLTTVLSNIYQAARRATSILLEAIDAQVDGARETLLPTELLVRRSCGYFRGRPDAPAEMAVSSLTSLDQRVRTASATKSTRPPRRRATGAT